MVVDTKLYEILGVSPDIDDQSLKRAYKKRVFECHPDKHPDDPEATEKFQQLNEAWEILKDPEKRRIYDEQGVDGLRESGDDGDVLSHLFGFSSPSQSRRRTRDIVQELSVTLEELFNGAEKTISSSRKITCQECHGTGCNDGGRPSVCDSCNGQGRVIGMQPVQGGYVRSIRNVRSSSH
jgi:DnaJ-class molecular chaperone